jgi:PAS domain S-box-containing protein
MMDPMDTRTSSAAVLPKGYVSECALAISNDSQTLELARSLLATEHINLITSRVSQRALELIRWEKPSLVLMDMSCSGLNLEALIAMTADEDSCTALVLLADEKNRDLAIQFVEEGTYDFIEKPLEPRTFRLLARRALHHANSLRFRRDYKRVLDETVEANNVDVLRRKDFLNGILNSSNLVSVVLTDLEQYVRFWNRGAENIFGYTAGEMIGTKVTRLYPQDPQSAETVEQLQTQVKSKADNIHGKMKQVAKDGRILTISVAVSPLLDGSGNVQGIVGIGQDVTEETRLHEELVKSFQMLKQTQDVSIFSLARLAESRDEETGLHLTRIQHYCRVLCRGLAGRTIYRDVMTPGFVEDLVRSSVLHDIGKVTIPDSILLHPGKFTPEQFAVMREHPIHGGQALDDAVMRLGAESFLSIGRDVAYYHHEHWDGKGYPFGLEGEAIPLSARIAAVADVYDALTTERRYKRAFTHEEACSIIQESKSKQFDPEIVDAFREVESEFRRIRNELSTNPDSWDAAGPSEAFAEQ